MNDKKSKKEQNIKIRAEVAKIFVNADFLSTSHYYRVK
jgi:hypothetical protein